MEYSIPVDVMEQAEMNGLELEEKYTDNLISSVSHTLRPSRDDKLPDPIDQLKITMNQRGLNQRDLMLYIGSSGNVSAILNRRRPLSLRMIRNLHKHLDIPAEILIQPYDCH